MAPDFSEIDKSKIKKYRHSVTFEVNSAKTSQLQKNDGSKSCLQKIFSTLPTTSELKQYISVIICVILLWGTSWFIFKDVVLPGYSIFNMMALVLIGYVFGHTLERYTTITPVVGMTLIGALFRTFYGKNFLENPTADAIDFHLRYANTLELLKTDQRSIVKAATAHG
ncbi:unnamed protein product [Euphydryas editha]|uniref:Uncharacterized protein n=1 Tax=Euphydryas editha TaxID=104508 RepID=A0AAU9UYX9_EUPED|nr:unnamed protein product [Euphydryas editha]